MTPTTVFLEIVASHRDEAVAEGWSIEAGAAERGSASCDFGARILRVPLGASAVERTVRAHELMHLRVSPMSLMDVDLAADCSARAVECAEEYRVNELLRRTGFDLSHLSDGSEELAGERLARLGAFAEAVNFYAAVLGTGAERLFVRGVRRIDRDWARALTVVGRRVNALSARVPTVLAGATDLDVTGVPRGFSALTVPIARLLETAGASAVPRDDVARRKFRRALEPGGRRAPSSRFAELVLDDSLKRQRVAQGAPIRRVRAEPAGTRCRYPNRLLTDPARRAFTSTRRRAGGIVVVDQSGSMDLEVDELESLLRQSPGALVIGYSHRPGDRSKHPNAWVLARDGERVIDIPSGNVGNGVDGPVLRWAIRHRRGREPIVWVTDGQVTDSNDHPVPALSRECAQLVRAHGIRLVRTLPGAERALRRVTTRESAGSFGRVGRELTGKAELSRTNGAVTGSR